MIAGLAGILEDRGTDALVINVGGVSYRVYAPLSTLSAVGEIGSSVRVRTHLHVREDNLTLYGFATERERELFELLIGVNGIGPKAALGLLSVLDPDKLVSAVMAEDVALLTRVPGIGRKTAARLILELKGKLETGPIAMPARGLEGDSQQILAALSSLGYSSIESMEALKAASAEADLPTEEKLRKALQHLAKAF
ncbi:MAG: Holliday junction branch migration protein RuvA [Chloroflexota bacterium]|nr:MAG: Holliday junction branch migration protein RuvA [Chloroflexota bacterium]